MEAKQQKLKIQVKKDKKIKGETNNSTKVGNFNTIFSIMDRTNRHKIPKEVFFRKAWIILSNQLDLIGIWYRTLHPTTEAFTFFSGAQWRERCFPQLALWNGKWEEHPLEVQWAKCFQFHHLRAQWSFQTENCCMWKSHEIVLGFCYCCCCAPPLQSGTSVLCPSHPLAPAQHSSVYKALSPRSFLSLAPYSTFSSLFQTNKQTNRKTKAQIRQVIWQAPEWHCQNLTPKPILEYSN